jgi:hypothetical protein
MAKILIFCQREHRLRARFRDSGGSQRMPRALEDRRFLLIILMARGIHVTLRWEKQQVNRPLIKCDRRHRYKDDKIVIFRS